MSRIVWEIFACVPPAVGHVQTQTHTLGLPASTSRNLASILEIHSIACAEKCGSLSSTRQVCDAISTCFFVNGCTLPKAASDSRSRSSDVRIASKLAFAGTGATSERHWRRQLIAAEYRSTYRARWSRPSASESSNTTNGRAHAIYNPMALSREPAPPPGYKEEGDSPFSIAWSNRLSK